MILSARRLGGVADAVWGGRAAHRGLQGEHMAKIPKEAKTLLAQGLPINALRVTMAETGMSLRKAFRLLNLHKKSSKC